MRTKPPTAPQGAAVKEAPGERFLAAHTKLAFERTPSRPVRSGSDMADQDLPPCDLVVGSLELSGIATTLALTVAAGFTAFDTVYHGANLGPKNILIAMAYAAVVSTPAALTLVAMLAGVFWALKIKVERRPWGALLSALALPALASAVFAALDPADRARLGLPVLAISVPAGAAAYAMLSTRRWFERPGRILGCHLLFLETVVLGACGSAVLSLWMRGMVAAPLGWALAMVAAVLLGRRMRHAPMSTSVVLLLALPLSVAGFSGFGMAWRPWGQPAAVATDRPNVVLVVLDTTRRDHIGAYGDPRGLTPRLNRIAAEGAVFEDVISPAPWTGPSHASIFTGWFPVTHGCSHEHHLWLNDDYVTLAEMLRDEGYQTLALNSNFYLERCNLLQGFETSVYLSGPCDQLSVRRLSNLYGAPQDWVDKGSGEAVAFLQGWLSKQRSQEKPLFLFLNLFESHRPYVVPQAERDAHTPPNMSSLDLAAFSLDFEPIPLHIQGVEDRETQKKVQALYAALIRYQDRRLGEILDVLGRSVDLDNTLLIITADHGENLGEAGRWEHIHAVNDTLIHVPLVIRYPRRFPAGTRVPGLCQTTDLVPTVFDVLQQSCPVADLPGRSLVPERFQGRERAFAQLMPYTLHFPMVLLTRGFEQGLNGFDAQRRVIRTDTMKYIWSSDGKHQLFDVRSDPFETKNLVAGQPELAAQLQSELLEWWSRQPEYGPLPSADPPAIQPLDREALERLRSLGYLGG
jgi:arylsulfatase A-like enzyme